MSEQNQSPEGEGEDLNQTLSDAERSAAAADEAGAQSAAPEEAGEGEAELTPLDVAGQEIAELRDKLLRAAAETENTRRRAQRELEDTRKYAVTDFAREVLGVADNLRRALEAVNEDARTDNADLNSLMEGVEMTERALLSSMEKYGIQVIDPMGEKLDPNFHQAVVQIDHPDAPAGTIVHVMQVGYKIHDRVLRAAMVGVAKGPGKAAGDSVDTSA